MAKHSTQSIFLVATILAVFCSVLVSSAVVLLADKQEKNMLLFKRSNVLVAAGLTVANDQVEEVYEATIEKRFVDLSKGTYTKAPDDPTFDSVDAAKEPAWMEIIPAKKDVARIKRRSRISEVYFFRATRLPEGFQERPDNSTNKADDGDKDKDKDKDENKDTITSIILPLRGKGLWSTMKGFLALDPTSLVVKGLSFYSHGETPGLGGEIDNPRWRAQWPGKRIYNDRGDVAIRVLKGQVPANDPRKNYHLDGLSGATLTSNGVTMMMVYWLGESGYQRFLKEQQKQGWPL
ncbi:MAG: NADH:ubiquinone reductase (Na(+)-transporting) subunit C [Proteobacteria bacterium]|nr:NADH:ubiquinone reductase (Na(+)-transporting) subunit C [Pseudomonadota bacterium]